MWTGRRTVTVGAAIGTRERAMADNMLGPCVDTVVLRSDADPDATAAQLLSVARRAVLDAVEHSEAPFEEVVLDLDPDRRAGRIPYVDVQINMNLRGNRHAMLGDSLLTPLLIPSLWSHDVDVPLTLTVMEENGDIGAILSYQGRLIAEKDATILADLVATGLSELVPHLDHTAR
jgi:non-ribosomal peptide synthetase component F